jgi:pyridoxal phosphate-dependent aminotransferase EpsN
MVERIYLSPPWRSGLEAASVARAVDSNWIAPLGPEVDAFESELAQVAGTVTAAATVSGTAAIHLALVALGVARGDVVIAPTFTFIGTVNPILYVGAEPWLVDSDASTWNIDPVLLAEALAEAASRGRRVGAVIAVDLFGQCADYRALEEVCESYGVPLVEDAAEALGSTYGGRPAGSFGRVGVFSFNGNKIITTSGGGALVSDDQALVDRCRHLATQAREPEVHYEHRDVGFNYRMSNVLAALGRAQLATLPERVAARRRIFDRYVDLLGSYDGISFMPEAEYGSSNRWLTTLTIDPAAFGASPLDIIGHLETMNIEARPVWKPMHLQPVFRGVTVFGGAVSEAIYAKGLCLPSGTGMTDDDIERVVGGVLASRTR